MNAWRFRPHLLYISVIISLPSTNPNAHTLLFSAIVIWRHWQDETDIENSPTSSVDALYKLTLCVFTYTRLLTPDFISLRTLCPPKNPDFKSRRKVIIYLL